VPTRIKATIAIRATIPILTYLPASGGGVLLSLAVLYNLTKLYLPCINSLAVNA
jgi:hypothetical protein